MAGTLSPTAPPTRLQRLTRLALSVFVVAGIALLLAAIFLPVPKKTKSVPPASPPGFVLPDFTLTERSGKTVTKADLSGKVWVASFVFIRCTGPCPSVSATMTKLQSELDLANQADLRLVTFTVDPDRDTPNELKKYADTFRANPDRWLFLTGKEDEIHTLLKTGFKIGVNRSTNPHPIAGQEFDHSTYITVVDKTGTIRGHFDGYRGPNDMNGDRFKESMIALKQLVADLLKE